MKRTFILRDEAVRQRAIEAIRALPPQMVVVIGEPTRSLSQNSMLWPILAKFEEQLLWPVNGRLEQLSGDEWKDILTAGWHGERLRLAAGLNGGVVLLGLRTSTMGRREFGEFLEFVLATAADRGVDLRGEDARARARMEGLK